MITGHTHPFILRRDRIQRIQWIGHMRAGDKSGKLAQWVQRMGEMYERATDAVEKGISLSEAAI